MSANYNKKDGLAYYPFKMDLGNKTFIESQFDLQTDYDAMDIELALNETKILKRICIIKTLLFPIEYLLMRLFVNKTNADDLLYIQKEYWNLLRNKIDTATFTNRLLKRG